MAGRASDEVLRPLVGHSRKFGVNLKTGVSIGLWRWASLPEGGNMLPYSPFWVKDGWFWRLKRGGCGVRDGSRDDDFGTKVQPGTGLR